MLMSRFRTEIIGLWANIFEQCESADLSGSVRHALALLLWFSSEPMVMFIRHRVSWVCADAVCGCAFLVCIVFCTHHRPYGCIVILCLLRTRSGSPKGKFSRFAPHSFVFFFFFFFPFSIYPYYTHVPISTMSTSGGSSISSSSSNIVAAVAKSASHSSS